MRGQIELDIKNAEGVVNIDWIERKNPCSDGITKRDNIFHHEKMFLDHEKWEDHIAEALKETWDKFSGMKMNEHFVYDFKECLHALLLQYVHMGD